MTRPASSHAAYQAEIMQGISKIPAADWDALVASSCPWDPRHLPLSHAYIAAAESTGVASPNSGWLPYHLLLWQQSSGAGGEDSVTASRSSSAAASGASSGRRLAGAVPVVRPPRSVNLACS